MSGEVDEETVVSLPLSQLPQTAEVDIVAKVTSRITAMLPLEPLLHRSFKQRNQIHLGLQWLVEFGLFIDLLLDGLIAGIVRDGEGLVVIGEVLSEVDRIRSYSEMQVQNALALPGTHLGSYFLDILIDSHSSDLKDGAGD